jgi:hypothetical protein
MISRLLCRNSTHVRSIGFLRWRALSPASAKWLSAALFAVSVILAVSVLWLSSSGSSEPNRGTDDDMVKPAGNVQVVTGGGALHTGASVEHTAPRAGSRCVWSDSLLPVAFRRSQHPTGQRTEIGLQRPHRVRKPNDPFPPAAYVVRSSFISNKI